MLKHGVVGTQVRDDGPVQVELLVVRDCPHRQGAEELLSRALAAVGFPRLFRTTVVETEAQALAIGFVGSPAFIIDGKDPFAPKGSLPGLACRLYPTVAGSAGLPDLDQLVDSLERHRTSSTARTVPGT